MQQRIVHLDRDRLRRQSALTVNRRHAHVVRTTDQPSGGHVARQGVYLPISEIPAIVNGVAVHVAPVRRKSDIGTSNQLFRTRCQCHGRIVIIPHRAHLHLHLNPLVWIRPTRCHRRDMDAIVYIRKGLPHCKRGITCAVRRAGRRIQQHRVGFALRIIVQDNPVTEPR